MLDQARGRIRAALSDRVGLGLAGLDLEVGDVWMDRPTGGQRDRS